MLVTASIVTYNNSKEILKVLSSISQTILKLENVYVIDNNSSDNTINVVEKNFPMVKLIKSSENLGYGKGHNQAIKVVNSDYHIIINPDIILEPESISKMIEYMENNKNVVILTPKVLNVDGSEQFLPKLRPRYKYLLGGRLPFKFAKKWRREYTMEDSNVIEPIKIDFCTGCFMFCRTSALKSVNGFDDRYFMYFEDADLTREMQKIGDTVYVPSISVTHEWKRESKKNKKLLKIHISSMKKYFKKWKSKDKKGV